MRTKIRFDIYDKKGYHKDSKEENLYNNKTEINTVRCPEYHRIDISLLSDDNTAYIKMNSIDDNLDDKDIIIRNNETKTICTYAVCENNLVPGYYCYTLFLNDKVLDGTYFISPSSVEWKSLIDLRSFLKSYISELAFNMYVQRKTNKFENDNLLPSSISSIYLYLKSKERILVNNIRMIIKNPICDIKKEYKENNNQGKLDMKSQKWLVTKGLSKNANIYIPEFVYSKHSTTYIDINENKWVKKIITDIIHLLFNIENSFYFKIKKSEENLQKIKEKKEKLTNQRNLSNEMINVGASSKYEMNKGIEYINYDIEKINKNIGLINENLIGVKKLKSLLANFNNESWLINITQEEKTIKPTFKLLKDSRYNILYNIYSNIENLNKKETRFRDITFSYKDTPTLFEYYSVLMTIEILKDIGFIWEKGWMADDVNMDIFSGEIPTGEPFIFINRDEDIKIELYYEKEIRSENEVTNGDKSDFSRGLSKHYKPDILIAIFDNCTDEYLTSIIIEVKCFKSRYLLTKEKDIPSKVVEQVISYHALGYYDISKQKKNRLRRDAIKKVIVVYPKQREIVEYPYDGRDIDFIQIEANNKDIYEHFGFDSLKNEIRNIVNQY